MEILQTLWSLFSLLSVMIMPQLLGALVYYRLKRFHLFAHLVGIILPPVVFLLLSSVLVFSAAQREAEMRGELVCGTFTGMMAMALLVGAGLQAVFSLIAQLAIHVRHRAAFRVT